MRPPPLQGGPSIKELKQDYGGEHISDEALILCYLVPEDDFKAAMAAGPVNPSYELVEGPVQLIRQLAMAGPSYLHVTRGDIALTLRRRSS